VPNGVSGLLPVTTFGCLGGRGQSGAEPAALAGAGRYAAREADVRDARAAPAMVASPVAQRALMPCVRNAGPSVLRPVRLVDHRTAVAARVARGAVASSVLR